LDDLLGWCCGLSAISAHWATGALLWGAACAALPELGKAELGAAELGLRPDMAP